MPRREVLLPTTIYWLCDTSKSEWPLGEPFYCGKSIDPKGRLSQHLASSRSLRRNDTGERIAMCPRGALVMRTMAVVPATGDWEAAERQWIAQMRLLNPTGCTNRRDGGQDGAGFTWTDEQRARHSQRQRGVPKSPEMCARLSATLKAKWAAGELHVNPNWVSPATVKGSRKSPEMRAKLRATMKAKWREMYRNAAPDRLDDVPTFGDIDFALAIRHITGKTPSRLSPKELMAAVLKLRTKVGSAA